MKSKFEAWFQQQHFYLNLRFIHGDQLLTSENSIYRVLAVQIAWATWMEQQKRIEGIETRINLLIQKWEKDAEYADQIASEDCVQNTLNDCIEELRQAIKGGDE